MNQTKTKKQRINELNKIIKEKRKPLDKLCKERNKLQNQINEENMKKKIGTCFSYSYSDEDYDGNKKRVVIYSKIVGIRYGSYETLDCWEDVHGKIILRIDYTSEYHLERDDIKIISEKVFENNFNLLLNKLKEQLK